jgi:hypothetical protein
MTLTGKLDGYLKGTIVRNLQPNFQRINGFVSQDGL